MSCIVTESLKKVTWPTKNQEIHPDHVKLEKDTLDWFKSFDAAKVEEFLKENKGISEYVARVHPYGQYDRVLITSKFYMALALLKYEAYKDISRVQEFKDKIVIISKKKEEESYNGSNLVTAMFSHMWVQICKLSVLDWQKHVIAMIEYWLQGAILVTEKRKENKCLNVKENDLLSPVMTWIDLPILFVEFTMNHFHVELFRMNATYLLLLTYVRLTAYHTMNLYVSRKMKKEGKKDVLNSVHWYELSKNLSYDEAVKAVVDDLDYKLKQSNAVYTLYLPMLPVDFEWMLEGLRHVVTGTHDYFKNHPSYKNN